MAAPQSIDGRARCERELPLHADTTKASCASFIFPFGLAALGFIFAAAVVEVCCG